MARDHKGVVRVLLHQVADVLLKAVPDSLLRFTGSGQMDSMEDPLDDQARQHGHYGQDQLEALEHLDSREEVGVHESVHDSRRALHGDHAGASRAVACGRKMNVAPSRKIHVVLDIDKLRMPLRREAAVQHLLDVSLRLRLVGRRVVDHPREVCQVERAERRILGAPHHVAHWVRLRHSMAASGGRLPHLGGDALAGQDAHDGLHGGLVALRTHGGADVQRNTNHDEEDKDHHVGRAVDSGEGLVQGERADPDSQHQRQTQEDGVEPAGVGLHGAVGAVEVEEASDHHGPQNHDHDGEPAAGRRCAPLCRRGTCPCVRLICDLTLESLRWGKRGGRCCIRCLSVIGPLGNVDHGEGPAQTVWIHLLLVDLEGDPVALLLVPDALVRCNNHVADHKHHSAEDGRKEAALDVALQAQRAEAEEALASVEPEIDHGDPRHDYRNGLEDNQGDAVGQPHRQMALEGPLLPDQRCHQCCLEHVQRGEVEAVEDEVAHLVAEDSQSHHNEGQIPEDGVPLEPPEEADGAFE
mmetsp:Transcript_32859/g.102464  ORF Transcript_32859/g.102464 Transcript_32859/m.102464 type:complete len:525 (-) Transcript_32859:473-2047(-)